MIEVLSVENMIIRRRIGDKAAVDLLKEAGFTGIDYSLCGMEDWDAVAGSKNALSYAEDLRRYAEDRGIVFSQSHAPFTFKYGMEKSTDNPHFFSIIQAMEFASHLGCPMIVVHGILVPEGEDVFAYNLDYYQRLLPYAEKNGILIAVENLTGRSGRYTQPTTRLFGSPEAFWMLAAICAALLSAIGPLSSFCVIHEHTIETSSVIFVTNDEPIIYFSAYFDISLCKSYEVILLIYRTLDLVLHGVYPSDEHRHLLRLAISCGGLSVLASCPRRFLNVNRPESHNVTSLVLDLISFCTASE